MKFFALGIAVFQGAIVVGALVVINAFLGAISPTSSLPFSPMWGWLATLPGIGMAVFAHKNRL